MMVAKELGMDVVEFNASDTRNKKSLASVGRVEYKISDEHHALKNEFILKSKGLEIEEVCPSTKMF